MRIATLLLVTWVSALPGCSPGETDLPQPDGDTSRGTEVLRPSTSEGSPETNAAATPDGAIRVVFLGTSLTEGLGLLDPAVEAWPARVSELADSAGLAIDVVNAGLSGETSAGALRRVDWVLQTAPDVLVLETGANDGLRALPTDALEANVSAIVARIRSTHPEVELVLVPMEAPPNLGSEYSTRFHEVFPHVAMEWKVALTPFILGGVAGVPELIQPDGEHPTAAGHRIMAENAWPVLDSIFRIAAERRASRAP
ncbi:MAG: arylesterase [Gemmatimonadetes bacterium]|nr:arylesterase [Gemmatimonadota bacterium]